MRKNSEMSRISRRTFLAGATTAALVIGFHPNGTLVSRGFAAAAPADSLTPNPFLRITANGRVTVIAKHFEMGQGTTTGLATLVAEELDADWDSVRVEWAPVNTEVYKNLIFGIQGTGGSTAIANSYTQYRKAGAAARELLVAAAATAWAVPAGEITTDRGRLTHAASGRTAPYGEMVGRAAALTPPAEPKLKTPDQFRLIGKHIPRKDSKAKTDGSAIFTMDIKLTGMLYTVMVRPPRFGATLRQFDATAALAIKGVRDVKQVPGGLAVYADSSWAAIKGRAAVTAEWDDSAAEKRGSAEFYRDYEALAATEGLPARREGDAAAALAAAAPSKRVSATYRFPFLAHAPMEPLNCVIRQQGEKAEVWAGSQFPTVEQGAVAAILGLKPANVRIHTLYAGGSFGRRANFAADYVAEAAHALKAIGGRVPVKLIWTREDDLKGGYYRPLYVHHVEAAIGADGLPSAWRQRIVGQSIMEGGPMASYIQNGVDGLSVEGAANLAYTVPNLAVDLHTTKSPVPILWWRSVGHTHTAYSTETVLDMLAKKAGIDPVDYRMRLLKDHPRHQGVLKLAAEKADWGKPLPAGWARGVAVHESFSSYVAEVAEISLTDGRLRVERVVCAVDCGVAVNPDVIRAQMEGGIGYGLGAILHNGITLKDGQVEQDNFPDYEPLRITEMPRVEVHIVPSTEAPTGVGEPGTPVIGPAVANAIFAATGKHPTDLPFTVSGIQLA